MTNRLRKCALQWLVAGAIAAVVALAIATCGCTPAQERACKVCRGGMCVYRAVVGDANDPLRLLALPPAEANKEN